jgi:hypothetical protein
MAVVLEEDDAGTKEAVQNEIKTTQSKLIEAAQAELDAVWMKILEDAILDCPFETGTLMSTVRLVEGGTGADIGMSYSPDGGGGEMAVSVYDSTIMAGDPNITKPNGEPCVYAEWVHDGSFNVRTGKMNIAQPWLENAIDKHGDELDAAIEKMMDAIDAE